jgi:hypothetical protein
MECWFENDPTTRQKAAFPLYKRTGTKNLFVVYFEIEPVSNLPPFFTEQKIIFGN